MGVGTDARVTFKRRHSYATRSNKIRKFRTPGGEISVQYTTKKAKGPACSVCHKTLQGIPRLRPVAYKMIKKNQRTVSRSYGGSICAGCLKDRVMRAFIVEEQKSAWGAQGGERGRRQQRGARGARRRLRRRARARSRMAPRECGAARRPRAAPQRALPCRKCLTPLSLSPPRQSSRR